MSFQGVKVFVTGAGGFIGSHLVEELVRQGAQVRAMVHYNSSGSWGNLEHLPQDILKSIEIYSGDVSDPVSAQKGIEGCSMVFHLAALIGIPYSYCAPHSYVSTNVLGTLNVLQACRDHGVQKMVHTSTSESYGTALYAPIDEKHPLQAQSPYSATKISADKIAESYFLSFGVPVATIRPFNTYGPRQSARAVIPTIISQALAGSGRIRLGSLDPVRDFTFVQDTVAGFLAIAKSENTVGRLVNVGTGTAVSIGQLAQTILHMTGSAATLEADGSRIRPENSEVMKLLCDATLAKELTGWTAKYALEQGLEKTIAFVRANQGLYKPQIYNV